MIRNEIFTSFVKIVEIVGSHTFEPLKRLLRNRNKTLTEWIHSSIRNYDLRILDLAIDNRCMPHQIAEYVDKPIVRAIKLLLIKKQIGELNNGLGHDETSSFQVKLPDEANPESTFFDSKYLQELDIISRKGLLKVLLTVYSKLLPSLVSKGTKKQSRKESKRIFNFVASLAHLHKWEPSDVLFYGDLARFVIVPVAARYPSTIQYYEKRIEEYSKRKNIDAIFVLAIGSLNILVAEKAAQSFHERNLEEFNIGMKNNYKIMTCRGEEKQATTILLSRKKNRTNSDLASS